ncbi:lipocalin family protein [uncultured Tenacibaculum sp.]|uniref:lipocalin family protein n=1 Tax=uncultured Tenacibaculum sp. TaxID=174713 RepID=UPI00261A43C4|nr:lipocalin family protein [uncultured Tenacibaculum sp.]
MKIKSTLVILTLILCFQTSNSQDSFAFNFNESDLIGIWVLKNSTRNGHEVFLKKRLDQLKYGLSTELFNNGKFRSRYSAPCGNDTSLFTENYTGEWTLDKKTSTITLINPKTQVKKILKIVDLTSEKLVVEKIKYIHPKLKKALDEIMNN